MPYLQVENGGYAMKKTIVSSAIFLIIILKPLSLNVEVFAYEILKSSSKYIKSIEISNKADEENNDVNRLGERIEAVDIDELFVTLDSNTREINELLEEKNLIIEKVQAEMDLRVATKIRMSSDQMNLFREFSFCCQTEGESIKVSLEKIFKGDLINVKNEILHTQSNCRDIFDKLSTMTTHQLDAIHSLKSIINSGTKTLEIL